MSNQLLTEADEPAELDEYSGMSAVDIAYSIINWAPGSEDQIRAIAALRRLAPDRHHNRPPIEERLDEDFAGLRGRADALMAVGETVLIVDAESASKALETGKAMVTLEKDVEELRKRLVAPYRLAVDLINARAKAIAGPVKLAREGADGEGGLRGMVTAYDNKARREAEDARLAAEAEQRKREEAAEAARRRAEEATEAGHGVVSAELQAAEAAEEAERARIRAEAIRPTPIRSNSAMMIRSREIKFTIDSLPKLLTAIMRLPGGAAAIEQFARTFLGKYLRGLGVNAVEKGVMIPGVTVRVELGSANVR